MNPSLSAYEAVRGKRVYFVGALAPARPPCRAAV